MKIVNRITLSGWLLSAQLLTLSPQLLDAMSWAFWMLLLRDNKCTWSADAMG